MHEQAMVQVTVKLSNRMDNCIEEVVLLVVHMYIDVFVSCESSLIQFINYLIPKLW